MTRVRAREERPDRLVSCPSPPGAPDTPGGAIVPAEAYAIPLSRCFEGVSLNVNFGVKNPRVAEQLPRPRPYAGAK